jgi:hypothetical protein
MKGVHALWAGILDYAQLSGISRSGFRIWPENYGETKGFGGGRAALKWEVISR